MVSATELPYSGALLDELDPFDLESIVVEIETAEGDCRNRDVLADRDSIVQAAGDAM